ncbi:hypothetical protein F4813DRAFT_399017 [Daldinia decipiens]|uniref:uncharacterized protein n=1 Tax=Daldinia decipiens TaxID=326647 RepID=UPI0020C30DCB|nr:uncharacterized protein F4813DRAFT_399017 [Daldinia decipiens]KAI1654264.1 hypothetical protein F4813DRAFT_399017 [Daldinia decipiens]
MNYPVSCANCGKPATTRCSGCLTAPEYRPGDAPATAYCDSKCQQQQWPTHKVQCRILNKRRTLLRIAELLKTALFAYRECVYDIPLTEVKYEEGILRLLLDPRKIPYRPWQIPFPSDLNISPQHKEAALATNQCTTAQCLLGPLARYLLGGIESTFKVVEVNAEPIVPWKFVWLSDSKDELRSLACTAVTHTILLVWLRGEGWVIDTTGCQFGFGDVLVPLNTYFKKRVKSLARGPFAYTEHETSDLDVFDCKLALNDTDTKRLKAAHERAGRLHFAKFVRERFDRYESPRPSEELLGGSSEEFQVRLARFKGDLKVHMASFVDFASGKERLSESG